MNEEELRKVIRRIIKEESEPGIPVAVSNRHVHLTEADYKVLFPHEEISPRKWLTQPKEYAANQVVTIVGPNGSEIQHVRVMGPCRKHSQVELARSDARNLGITVPVRLSGELDGTPSIKVKTKDGEVTIQGVIAAKRHIHMSDKDAERFGVKYGETVEVAIETNGRRTIYDDVIARPNPDFVLEMHIDVDEANAACVGPDTVGHIIPKDKRI